MLGLFYRTSAAVHTISVSVSNRPDAAQPTVPTAVLYKYTLHRGAVIYVHVKYVNYPSKQRSKIHFMFLTTLHVDPLHQSSSTCRLQRTSLQYLDVMLNAVTRCPGYPVRRLAGKYNPAHQHNTHTYLACTGRSPARVSSRAPTTLTEGI